TLDAGSWPGGRAASARGKEARQDGDRGSASRAVSQIALTVRTGRGALHGGDARVCRHVPRHVMPNLINLPSHDEDGQLQVVVEAPRGSRAKFKYDATEQSFKFAR